MAVPGILIPSFVMNLVSLFVDLMYWYAKNAPNITNPTKIIVIIIGFPGTAIAYYAFLHLNREYRVSTISSFLFIITAFGLVLLLALFAVYGKAVKNSRNNPKQRKYCTHASIPRVIKYIG